MHVGHVCTLTDHLHATYLLECHTIRALVQPFCLTQVIHYWPSDEKLSTTPSFHFYPHLWESAHFPASLILTCLHRLPISCPISHTARVQLTWREAGKRQKNQQCANETKWTKGQVRCRKVWEIELSWYSQVGELELGHAIKRKSQNLPYFNPLPSFYHSLRMTQDNLAFEGACDDTMIPRDLALCSLLMEIWKARLLSHRWSHVWLDLHGPVKCSI